MNSLSAREKNHWKSFAEELLKKYPDLEDADEK